MFLINYFGHKLCNTFQDKAYTVLCDENIYFNEKKLPLSILVLSFFINYLKIIIDRLRKYGTKICAEFTKL